jgi:hypothetical protein
MIKGGPKIIDDSLVLCLDAHDAKSYAGEPTTNVVTYTDLNTGWSKGYQSNIVYDDIEPPAGINSQVVGHTRGNSSGYWYSYGNYAPQDPSVVYVVSMYVKTLDSNFRIAFYTADNSETGRYSSSYITVPNDGKWHRVVWPSFTNPSNSQSDSLSFNFSYNGAIGNASTKTWFCAPQMEAKSYTTPFVAGSRSATDGWVDRSDNSNDGTLVNGTDTGVSHYRDGEVIMPVSASYLDLDGSDDYVTVSATGTKTVEVWFNPDTTSGTNILYGPHANGHDNWLSFSTLVGLVGTESADTNNFSIYGGSVSAGNWYQAVAIIDGTTATLYVDGSQVATTTKAFTIGSWSGNATIGRRGALSQSYANAQIAVVRVYNKALTATEVLQNYNATKGRFS